MDDLYIKRSEEIVKKLIEQNKTDEEEYKRRREEIWIEDKKLLSAALKKV